MRSRQSRWGRKRPQTPRAGARWRRAGERGAAVFVVVLVITLLMGIGMFAARSATLATTVSGHERQAIQTQYVTDYAVLVAASMLSSDKKAAYIKLAKKPLDMCTDQNNPPGAVLERSCYRSLSQTTSQQLAAVGGVVPAGGLGSDKVEADFLIELTDVSAGPTPSGYNQNPSNQTAVFCYVTTTATGQVRLVNTGNPGLDTNASASASTGTARAVFLVGPLPPDACKF
jgi:hypothetical protein